MTQHYVDLLCSMGRPKILVVGDVVLDKYLWGQVDRISPESPVPILQVHREEQRPGGAANVAMNLTALGAHVSCVSVVGGDKAGRLLVEELRSSGVDVGSIVVDVQRETPVKTRCIGGSQQMLRLDHEGSNALSPDAEEELLAGLLEHMREADLVIVSDYAKGCLSDKVLSALFQYANDFSKSVIVGPKGVNFTKYQGCLAVIPNLVELGLATTLPVSNDSEIAAAGAVVLESVGCDFVVVTRGDEGMTLLRRSDAPLRVRGQTRQVADVTGAGDTSVAVIGLALACKVAVTDAVKLANIAGGLAVTRVGAATVTREELLEDLRGRASEPPVAKTGTYEELQERLRDHREQGKAIVFTNGCFDILHVGHLQTLRYAKQQGDILVVGTNSDESITRLKGPGRPIVTEENRVEMLAALQDVDYVVVFPDDTPLPLLERIRPNVLVKGGDYQLNDVVGADLVKTWSARVLVAPAVEGVSTSKVLERLMQQIS